MNPYKKIVIDKVVPTTIALKNGKELHALLKKETAHDLADWAKKNVNCEYDCPIKLEAVDGSILILVSVRTILYIIYGIETDYGR